VAKPEWGAKHICHNCGTRYYDMHRAEIVCPKCNTPFDPEALLKSRRSRGGFTGDVLGACQQAAEVAALLALAAWAGAATP